MTLKDFMLGTATAALISGAAVAQTEATATTETEVPMEESAVETNEPAMSETETDMTSEEVPAPEADAGAEIAPEAAPLDPMTPPVDMAEVPTSIEEMTVDQVLGKVVTGVDDETIGEIDYVIGEGGTVSFVIGIGGFLGLGEYTVAIPAGQFSLDAKGGLVLGSMTRAELEAQPEFDESTAESLPGDILIGSVM